MEITRSIKRGSARTFFGQISEDGENRLIRMTAVTGFTLQEIKDGKIQLGDPSDPNVSTWMEERFVKFPPGVLNPQHTILVPGMGSLEQFKKFYEDEQGNLTDAARELFTEILEALPTNYREGTGEKAIRKFIGQQRKLLVLYRPATAGSTEEN